MSHGLKALMVSCVPLAANRDDLEFEDRQAALSAGRVAGNGEKLKCKQVDANSRNVGWGV